jgi:predicted alternative tryptophan synthase beta-subunit
MSAGLDQGSQLMARSCGRWQARKNCTANHCVSLGIALSNGARNASNNARALFCVGSVKSGSVTKRLSMNVVAAPLLSHSEQRNDATIASFDTYLSLANSNSTGSGASSAGLRTLG